MSVETELKLRIAPENLSILKSHSFLRSLSCKPAVSRKLHNTYFDTPDLHLLRQHIALRLRRIGRKWLQTLKGGGAVIAGLHQRNEWETQLKIGELDFNAFEAIGAPPVALNTQKKLRPIFDTDFTRSLRIIKFEGAEIELCLDQGIIQAGEKTLPISEVELELKSGEPLQLYRLALALLEIVPFQIENISKAEYGYRLFKGFSPGVYKALSPGVGIQDSVCQALQKMLWSCLSHLQANVPGVLQQADPEYLHQVRVALRRLKVVLNMAASLGSDDELAWLKQRLGMLSKELGQAREWDVFVNETLPSLLSHSGMRPEYKKLQGSSQRCREASYQVVQDRLSVSEFQRFLLDFGTWMHGGYWQRHVNSVGIVPFAHQVLSDYRLKVQQRAKCISDGGSSTQLHKLRIACKNLRYCSTLFFSLHEEIFGNKNSVDALIKLQDILGKLNDDSSALQKLNELHQTITHGNLEWVSNIHCNRLDLLGKLGKAWKNFQASES